jgi:AcrR family transcriptional regulator
MLATALAIIDEEGADALSMRALALRLGSGTATLYRHFEDRTDLIVHVVDRVFGEVRVDPEQVDWLGWQESCRSVARAMFDALTKHRNIAPLLIELVPTGDNALRIRERCIATLLAGGFSKNLAVLSWATLAHYVLGFAIQTGSGASSGLRSTGRLSAVLRGLDASEFPATLAVADAMPVPIEEEFAFGLDLIIKGLSQVHGVAR